MNITLNVKVIVYCLLTAINLGNPFLHPHTVITTFSSDTKTPYEFLANKSQIKSRSLLYAFAIAAAKAKQQFGVRLIDYIFTGDPKLFSTVFLQIINFFFVFIISLKKILLNNQ